MASYSLQEIALRTEASLVGNPEHLIWGVGNLESAQAHEATFLENPRYEKQLEFCLAGVIFITPSTKQIPGKNYLITSHPSLCFQKVIELFIPSPQSGFSGIHPTAVIHPESQLGEGVTIGPHVVIDRGAQVGPRTILSAQVFIGAEATIGSNCFFHPHVTVREGCEIGHRVILQPGAVIGSCGFGYYTDKKGKHTLLRQVGKVVIEDDVEIGANTTIDRARFKETRIRQGTKIDNLVQIAHQVDIGEDSIIVSQVGIAGSTEIGPHAVIGGQAGIAGHLKIVGGTTLLARSGVSKSLLEPGLYSGAPAAPIKEAHAQVVHLRNISKLVDKVKEIESKLNSLGTVQQ